MTDPVKAVENAAGEIKDKVVEEGKSFFSSLLSAPIDLVKGIAGTLWGTATGGIKGLFSGVFGNLYNTLLTTGGIFLSTQIVPDLVAWLPLKIKGKNVGHIMAEHAQEGGALALIKDSAIAAVALNAAVGGAKGVMGGMADGVGTKDTPTAEKVGSVATSLAVVAGLGALAFSQVKSNGIGFAGNGDQSSKTPDQTPAPSATAPTGQTVS